MAEKGIVGRGVLLDYHSWRLKNRIEYDAFKTSPIPLEHLKAVAREQGVTFKFGDILLVRSGVMPSFQALLSKRSDGLTGFMSAFQEKSKDDIEALAQVMPPNLGGVEQTEEVLEWIWNHFSAVAGDHPSFECYRMSCSLACNSLSIHVHCSIITDRLDCV